MGKTLVLAEKPSVARDIAKVLNSSQSGNGCLTGAKYIVTWALGHLVTLRDIKLGIWKISQCFRKKWSL